MSVPLAWSDAPLFGNAFTKIEPLGASSTLLKFMTPALTSCLRVISGFPGDLNTTNTWRLCIGSPFQSVMRTCTLIFFIPNLIGAYPTSNPVTPQDLIATLYHCLGVDPHTVIYDLQHRPYVLVEGTPVRSLL